MVLVGVEGRGVGGTAGLSVSAFWEGLVGSVHIGRLDGVEGVPGGSDDSVVDEVCSPVRG